MGVLSLDEILEFFKKNPDECENVVKEEGGGINLEDIKQNWDKEGAIGDGIKEAISNKFTSLLGGGGGGEEVEESAGGQKRGGVVGDIAEKLVQTTCPLIHKVGCCIVQCLKDEKQNEVQVEDKEEKAE
eukprot:GHVU01022768.1.p2 GENE.GHVU01022768.1~~GHVU01022768.1.p2  ORF type:complete len:129 (+),score=41.30 GHVU01022768.1:78-464(+)